MKNMPAIAIATVVPDTTTVRPDVCAVRSSAAWEGSPRWRSSRERIDVEERVVDADRHADQDDDDLRRVVDRKHLADRPEQAERGGDRGQREHDRDDGGEDRAEREEQDEQRHRDREQLGAVEVAVDDAIARVARRDVAGLLDRHAGVRRRLRRAPARAARRSRPAA